jgi:hypothetical protein
MRGDDIHQDAMIMKPQRLQAILGLTLRKFWEEARRRASTIEKIGENLLQ